MQLRNFAHRFIFSVVLMAIAGISISTVAQDFYYCKDPMPPAGENSGCNICQYHDEIYVEYMPGMGMLVKLWKRCNGPADGKCVDISQGMPNRLCKLTDTDCPATAVPKFYQDLNCTTVVAYGGANNACQGQKYKLEATVGVAGVSCKQ